MERLTRKDKRTTSGYYIPNDYSIYHQKEFIKLGQLEDLEEELGIDLLTLFKVLKNNIWNNKTKRQEWVVLDYSNNEYVLKTTKELYIDDNKSILSLKDYKKTWWLKEDLEDEKKD